MDAKDLEKVVLQGLECEKIEKEKSSERKALTRKHGLNPEDAKYIQNTKGQTRDFVAVKLGISGRHWERMKFIYSNKDQCIEQEYNDWREGRLSTSKLYGKLKNVEDIAADIDKILDALWRLDINSPRSTKQILDDLNYTLWGDSTKRDKVFSAINEIKQIYDEYAEDNDRMLMNIIGDVEKIKKKISRK